MTKSEKKKLIKDFIDGPLQRYLTGETSYGKFKEEINEQFDLDFKYSDLYPSFLFNAELYYPTVDDFLSENEDKDIYIDARIERDPNYANVIKDKKKENG
jgi:hypothetical protein